jgi:hypothetical protein
MKKLRLLFMVTTIVGLGATAAEAQRLPEIGTCTGALSGTVGIAVRNQDGTVDTLPSALVSSLFGAAECACDTQDLNLQVKLTQALPAGTQGSVEVWVGTACDNLAVRTAIGSTQCERIQTIDIDKLTTLSGVGPEGILVPIPSRTLFSPVVHDCAQASTVTNKVYLLAFTNPTTPFATCTLDLNESTAPPVPVTQVTTTRDPRDGAVKVHWLLPDVTSPYYPLGFQLLCADDAGQPIGNQESSAYSVCQDGMLARRALSSAHPSTSNLPATAPLASLSPAYVCSPPVASSQSETVLQGIDPHRAIHVTVVAFDKYGNTSASSVVDVAPLPPAPASPSHGCSFAGASHTPPLGVCLLALATLMLLGRARRRS